MPQAARTILHQHMIQGDLTDLQVAALRWRALFNKAKSEQINYRVLYESLRNLEERWERDLVSAAEVSLAFHQQGVITLPCGAVKAYSIDIKSAISLYDFYQLLSTAV